MCVIWIKSSSYFFSTAALIIKFTMKFTISSETIEN